MRGNYLLSLTGIEFEFCSVCEYYFNALHTALVDGMGGTKDDVKRVYIWG